MKDEINKIIEMYEKGVITKDEMIELIEAIKTGEKRDRRKKSVVDVDGIVGDAFRGLKDTLKGSFEQFGGFLNDKADDMAPSENDLNVSPGDRVRISVLGGDVAIKRTEGDLIKVKRDSFGGNIQRENKVIKISFFGGGGEILLPESIKNVKLKITGGNAKMEGEFEEVFVDVKGGNMNLTSTSPGEVFLKVFGGNFNLYTHDKLGGEIDLKVTSGEFHNEIEGDFSTSKSGSISGSFGSGKDCNINGKLYGGNFYIKKIK